MMRSPVPIFKLVALLFLAADPASAAISDQGVFEDVTKKFLDQASTWGGTITGYASWLFWALATISMVWTFGFMALRKADIGEYFAEFLRFTITTGFFWWLLSNGPQMGISIINGLRQIGAEAGGISAKLSPSTPVDIAFSIVKKALSGVSLLNPIDNMVIVIVVLVLILCMAVVAANILIALVTAWTMAYAGVFILGFGGSRWTSDMAISYFKSMLAIGLELMTMALLIGVATSVLDGFVEQLDAKSIYELLVVLTVCAVLAMLISKIPGRIASLAGTGGSGASVSAGGALGAAALAGAAAATAGASLLGAAAQVAGAGSALKAAVQKASAAAESGGSSLASAFGGGGGGGESGGGSSLPEAMGDGGGSDGGGGSNGSGGGMATKAAKIVAGTVLNLMQGGMDTIKAKSDSMQTAFVDRVADTVGGKIASNIKASEGGDHLAPVNDEVADFANRR